MLDDGLAGWLHVWVREWQVHEGARRTRAECVIRRKLAGRGIRVARIEQDREDVLLVVANGAVMRFSGALV